MLLTCLIYIAIKKPSNNLLTEMPYPLVGIFAVKMVPMSSSHVKNFSFDSALNDRLHLS